MEDTELCIHDEASYNEAVNRLDSILHELFGKKKLSDPDEQTFYLMEKVDRREDAITDYEVALMQARDNEL